MRLPASFVATVAALFAAVASAAPPIYPDVSPEEPLRFPRDHGAHREYRTEWWYVTGWLKTDAGEAVGFQVTFFRSRLPVDDANPSRFAPRQMLFAHAALADPAVGRLVHDERIARAGFGIAEASSDDAEVVLDDWRFARVRSDAGGDGGGGAPAFATFVRGSRFALDLDFRANAAPLAQGADAAHPGFSQKGPDARDASRYYSVPQLAARGTIARGDAAHRRTETVVGTAWLDHEWSSAYLDPAASGWDWIGLDLDDGGALMAFSMRDRVGAKLWAGGARRFADGRVERYGVADVDFVPLRRWRSPASGASWPVVQRVDIRGPTPTSIALEPLMDDQELDSRLSTGTIYWEGAVTARSAGAVVGRGYLELTGYVRPMRF